VKRVSQRSAKSRGFSPSTPDRFPPTGNVDRVGWDKPQIDPSTVIRHESSGRPGGMILAGAGPGVHDFGRGRGLVEH
jgi:hypothetical protein